MVSVRNGQYFFSDTNRLKNFGASVSLGKQLKWPDDFFTLVYSLNYTQYKLINYPLFTQAFRSGTSNNVNFKVALSRNSSGPNPIFPVGWVKLSVERAVHSAVFVIRQEHQFLKYLQAAGIYQVETEFTMVHSNR